MTTRLKKRVINLDPISVREETLVELKNEVQAQADDDIEDISVVDTVVLDLNENMDSHATIFTEVSINEN